MRTLKEKLITALTFVKNGKFIVVGTYYGKCYFYTSEVYFFCIISICFSYFIVEVSYSDFYTWKKFNGK